MRSGIMVLPDGRRAEFKGAISGWQSDDPALEAELNAWIKKPRVNGMELYRYTAHPVFQHFYDMVLVYKATVAQHPQDDNTYPEGVVF